MFQEEEIKRGMALLDVKSPGWVSRVDADNLDVDSYFLCPLGQLFRSFGRGMDALGQPDAVSHGFAVPDGMEVQMAEQVAALEDDVLRMNETWRELIAQRTSPV